MWRYAFRRAFFGLIGLFLLAAPLFAGMRYSARHGVISLCQLGATECGKSAASVGLLRDGFGYLVWQAGGPKWDYWPLAVVLLAGVGAIDLALMLRGRLRRRAA